jgi:hypothetical protein
MEQKEVMDLVLPLRDSYINIDKTRFGKRGGSQFSGVSSMLKAD